MIGILFLAALLISDAPLGKEVLGPDGPETVLVQDEGVRGRLTNEGTITMAIPAGFPTAETTGVVAGTVLKTYTGPMTITKDGTVIENMIINGSLRVTADNVVIKNCKIVYNDFWGIDAEGADNITIQDCDIIGPGYSGHSTAAILGAGNFLRNDISGVEHGITLTAGSSVVKGNYIHDGGSNLADPHIGGVSLKGGQNGVLIEGNTIIGKDTSDIFLQNYFDGISNVTIKYNYLAGTSGYPIYVEGRFDNPPTTNVTITDNYIVKGYYGYYSITKASPVISGNLEILPGASPPANYPRPPGSTTTDPTTPTAPDSGSNEPPNTPVDIDQTRNKVKEGAAVGTKCGVTASAKDGDGDKVTYKLVDDAGGRFSIDSSTGVVRVANSSLLDRKIASEHDVVVKATDSSGASSTASFEIDVTKAWSHKWWGTRFDDRISWRKMASSEDGANINGKAGDDVLKGGSASDALLGQPGDDVLKGSKGNDKLHGGTGNDFLNGGKGDDLLGGGRGKNVLKGGDGTDSFLFDSNPAKSRPDKIKDFQPGTDHILLDHSAFKTIGPAGALSEASFEVGSEASRSDTRILYNSENGKLIYDGDGNGGAKGVVFAKVGSDLDISAGDFLIV